MFQSIPSDDMSSYSQGTPCSRASSRVSSIASSRASSRKPPPAGFRCNRCCSPMSTTVFVCSCDCAFCEECTYEHFNSNSACPNCSRELDPNDFMELVVADPTAASQEALKNTFQTIFTKYSPDSELCQQDMCHRLLTCLDNDKRGVRFLMKQFMVHSKHEGQQSGSINRAYETLKEDYVLLKQSSNSQKLQSDQIISDLQQRVQALQSMVDEKENQICKFRKIYAREGIARIPSSPHSIGSNSRGGGSLGSYEGRRQQKSHPPNTPPLQAYLMQKQAREREKDRALGQVTRRNIHGPEVDSIFTPIEPPKYIHVAVDSIPPPGSPRNSGGFVFPSQRNRPSSYPPFAQKRKSPHAHRHQRRGSNYSRSRPSSSGSGHKFATSRRR